jgi:N-dimethylarginine dimethylaminohydrolase
MSKLNTKELCNPKKYMTEEQIKEWRRKNSESNSKRTKEQWANPESRLKLLQGRKVNQQGKKYLYKDGEQKVFMKDKVEQALQDGWLPYRDYLNKGGTLSWL